MKFQKIKVFTLILFSLLLQQCCTSQDGVKEGRNEEKKITEHFEIEKPLPRGVIDLNGKIIKVFKKEKKTYCLTKIKKINGYGGSVRPLAINSEYEFEIESKLIETVKSNVGNTTNFHILSLPSGIGQKKLNIYKIISINK